MQDTNYEPPLVIHQRGQHCCHGGNTAGSCPRLVAVHVGAGMHSQAKEPAYKAAMRHAYAAAAACLDAGGSALRAVAAGIAVLEVSLRWMDPAPA